MAQDTHQRAKERFACAKEAVAEQFVRMRDDLKFSNPTDPQQWDEGVRKTREQDAGGARPCLTFDQTNQYIAQVVNDSRQNKPSIKIIPVGDGADVEVAQSLEGMIRHIEYQSRAGIAYDTAQEYAARIGLGWFRILPEVVNAEQNQQEIRIKRVHDPLSIVVDPDSTEPDGSDMTYGFAETMMTKAAFERAYPKRQAQSWDQDGWYSHDQVRVCEYFDQVKTKQNNVVVQGPDGTTMTVSEDEYWRMAQATGFRPPVVATFESETRAVKWIKMSGCEVLEETDFPSRWIPLIPVFGYELFVEGKRYVCGMVRRMRDAQMAYNYERSAYIEQVALQPKSPYLAPTEAIEGYESRWANANTSNQAFLPYNAFNEDGTPIPPPQRSMPPPIPAAFAQGGQIALDDLQASIGMYRANLGAPSNEKSGRAILARQREGDTANFHYIDNLSRSIEHAGRIIVEMIPRIYDTKRIAQITKENGDVDQVTVDPAQGSATVKVARQISINPNIGTYDVRVKVGPSYTTMRQETVEQMTEMFRAAPGLISALGPMWARMQDWPEADKVAKILLAMAPPAVQKIEAEDRDVPPELIAQMEQMQQAMQQMQQALEQAQNEEQSKLADAQNEAEQKQIDWYKAETDRLQVTQSAMGPEQIAVIVAQTLQQLLAPPGQPSQQMNEPPPGGFFSPPVSEVPPSGSPLSGPTL